MHIADEVVVRAERVDDRPRIDALLREAFPTGDVADRVDRLRETPEFLPAFSLVGEVNDEIVGYALLTRVTVDDIDRRILALAPVAVAPAYRRKGIGKVIVHSALRFAETHGFSGVVVAGPEAYFHRFGFQSADRYGLTSGFDLDFAPLLALPLKSSEFPLGGGVVRYMAGMSER